MYPCILLLTALSALGVNAEPWSDFRVTFTMKKEDGFKQLPRTKTDAENSGWVSINSDCLNEGKYSGFRYILKDDYSVAILYDVNGDLAGLQMMLPEKKVIGGKSTIKLDTVPMYQPDSRNGQEHLVLTSYFVDPETICNGGRSEEDKKEVATGVWLQNGSSPASVIKVPKKRSDAINEGWTKNACFNGMGVHNFYAVDTWDNTNCDQIFPVFLLYNNLDDLIGYGHVCVGKVVNPRFENPPFTAIKEIVKPDTPICLQRIADEVGITAIHVFFGENPSGFTCG